MTSNALLYLCMLLTVLTIYSLYRVYRVTKYGSVIMADRFGHIEGSGY